MTAPPTMRPLSQWPMLLPSRNVPGAKIGGWLPKEAVAAQNTGSAPPTQSASAASGVQAERGWLPKQAVAVQNAPAFQFGAGTPAVFTFGQTPDAVSQRCFGLRHHASALLVNIAASSRIM